MKYTTIQVPISLQDINRALGQGVPERPFSRSKGTHLSDIISRMGKESGRLQDKMTFGRSSFQPLDEDNFPAQMFLGMAVEDLLVRMNPWLERVGELCEDGIAMSPDGVTFESKRHLLSPHKADTILSEIKCTYKSMKTPLEERINYLQQMKSYCRALDTRLAILWCFFVNGDYSFGGDNSGPRLVQYHIEFGEFELKSNWDEILRKKAEYGL